MLTGYKIDGDEIAISKSYNNKTSSVFKTKDSYIQGAEYKGSAYQVRVLPDTIYYKHTNDGGFAAYGTALYGGEPDIILRAGDHYYKLQAYYSGSTLAGYKLVYATSINIYNGEFNNSQDVGISYPITQGNVLKYGYILGVCAVAGGGSGKKVIEITGGGGIYVGGGSGASGYFRVKIPSISYILRIKVGKGGSAGGNAGGDTVISIGKKDGGMYVFNNLVTLGGGGIGNWGSSSGGSGGTYTLHDSSNQYIYPLSAGRNPTLQVGKSGGSASGSSVENGVNSSVYYPYIDYKQAYNKTTNSSINYGGTGYSTIDSRYGGGGASGFQGSTAGTQGNANGSLGAGGAGSGSGGDGQAVLWIPERTKTSSSGVGGHIGGGNTTVEPY